jgi:hypothetical protein
MAGRAQGMSRTGPPAEPPGVGDDLGLLARHRDGYYGSPGPDTATEAEFAGWLDGLLGAPGDRG